MNRTQQNVTSYTCASCGKVFRRNQSLLQHMWNKHPADKSESSASFVISFKQKPIDSITTSVNEEKNPDNLDPSFPLEHWNSQTVFKQEKDTDSVTNEADTSITTFPDTLHSQMLIKKESSTMMLNYTCQVKTEPESENDQSCEDEVFVDDPLGITIKQEIPEVDAIEHYLKEDEENDENQLKASEAEDNGAEMNGYEYSLCDEDDTYACDLCKETFISKYRLNKHKAQQHSIENLPSCDICGKTFVWQCQLKSHKVRSHSNERPYLCDVCGKAFKLKAHLNEHKEVVHSNKRPYTCDICKNTFKLKTSLQRHTKACHSTKRHYTCDVCGEAFRWNSVLSYHKVARHSNERPYSCDLCGKTFNWVSVFRYHKSSCHSNCRPYSCDICGMAFKRSQTLKEHKVARHCNKEPTESCDVCGKTFKLRSYLVRHKNIHND